MRSAAASLATLAALAPVPAAAATRLADLAPRVRVQLGGPLSATLSLAVRVPSDRSGPALGPTVRVYRATPELVLGLQPAPRVDLFAAAGAGPMAIVTAQSDRLQTMGLAATVALGVRVHLHGADLTASARAETLGGRAVALTFGVRVDLDR